MVSVLEDSTAAAANRQLQDMLNNAITDPDKFRNLSITVKAPHVGKNSKEVSICSITVKVPQVDYHSNINEASILAYQS